MLEFKLWNCVYNFIEFIQFPMNFELFELFKLNWLENCMGYCCTWASFQLAQLLGPPLSGLTANGEDRGAWPWCQGRGGGGRSDSRRGAARDGGAAASKAWRRGDRPIWGETGTTDSPDGPLHGGVHRSSRGADEGCRLVAVGVDGGPMRCVRTRWSSWRRRQARRAAGGVEVFTVKSGRRRLQARRRRGLRTARVDGWSLADGDRHCGKEDATPRQSVTWRATQCAEEQWHGSRARRDRGRAKWGLVSPFNVKATNKGDKGDGRGGGVAWATRGGREEHVARGSAVGFAATQGVHARKKWPMGQLSGWAWVSTVEPGSAQDRTNFF
jgi:hypothetical protein